MAEEKSPDNKTKPKKKGLVDRYGDVKEKIHGAKEKIGKKVEKVKEAHPIATDIAKGLKLSATAGARGLKTAVRSPYSEARRERVIENFKKGIIIGAILGALAVIFLGGIGRGIGAILLGVAAGALIGAILGFVFAYIFPHGIGKGFFVFLFILGIFVVGFILFGYYRVGVLDSVISELLPGAEVGLANIGSGLGCLVAPVFGSEEKIRECYMSGGWGSEIEEEVIALDVEFKTHEVSYDGREKEIRAEIRVINDPEEGTEFTLEPQCYVDDKEVDTTSFGTKEGSKLFFYEREQPQKASVICSIPPEMLKDKNNVEVKIKMLRPVIEKVEWSVFTISRETLEKGDVPQKLFGKDGDKVGYPGIPYKLGIGVDVSVPLTEGEHLLYVELEKVIGAAEISEIKEINYVRVRGIGETASLDYCEGFKQEGDTFVLKDVTESKIKEERIHKGKIWDCEMSVSPEEDEKQVFFEAEISFLVELEEKTKVIVVSSTV